MLEVIPPMREFMNILVVGGVGIIGVAGIWQVKNQFGLRIYFGHRFKIDIK